MNITDFREHVNFRDLGNIPTADGRLIRPGLFYRSGGLFLMSRTELKEISSAGIKTIMDLRTKAECDKLPDPQIPGAQHLQYSGVLSTGGDEIDFSPAGMSLIGSEGWKQLEDLTRYYVDMPYHNKAFAVMLEAVRNDQVPMLIHCASGKDRTGIAVMLLLGLLGCEHEVILQDYLLSNHYCRVRLEKGLRDSDVSLDDHPERKELLQMQLGVSERIGRAVIDSVIDRYGSWEQLLCSEYDISVNEMAEIRDRYLYGR